MKTGRSLIVVVALLVVCALVAGSVYAKGQNVTIKNMGTRTVHILACYGGDGDCSQKDEKKQLVVEPGQSVVLESGGESVCFCSSKASKISNCAEGTWLPAKPGSYKRVGK